MNRRAIPNIDEMGISEIKAWIADTEDEHSRGFTVAREYARLAAEGLHARHCGDMVKMLAMRSACDALYATLPKEDQWAQAERPEQRFF